MNIRFTVFAKLIFGFLFLAIVSSSSSLLILQINLSRDLDAAFQKRLKSTAKISENLITFYLRMQHDKYKIVADEVRVKAVVETQDEMTINFLSKELLEELGAASIQILAPEGSMLSSVGVRIDNSRDSIKKNASILTMSHGNIFIASHQNIYRSQRVVGQLLAFLELEQEQLKEWKVLLGADVALSKPYEELDKYSIRIPNMPYLSVSLSNEEEIQAIVRAQEYLLFSFVMAVLVACFMSLILAKSFTRIIHCARQALLSIGDGNYSISISTKRKDEFGDILRATAELAANLQESRSQLVEMDYVRSLNEQLEQSAKMLAEQKKIIESRTRDLEKMALYDALTNLANRRMYIDQLNELIAICKKSFERFAVVFIDIDNFKRINDTLGHDVGDELLVKVSHLLKAAVRSSDIVARLGGDEFTLLLPQLSSVESARVVLDKVLDAFQRPIALNNTGYLITPSIGVAIAPDNGMEVDQLMRCADMAMYKAKKSGKNCYFFFTSEMDDAIQHEVQLEQELLEAVNEKEFRLFYQPIIDFKSGCVVGLEGLLRWMHPEKGLLGPDQFIDMLESSGQIVSLGNQIIECACLGKRYLDSLGMEYITISINVSVKQFSDPLLIDKFHAILKNYSIHPSSFQLEITEQTLMANVEEQSKKLNVLRKLGFGVAIDDFGTGYSSLAYIKNLPVDTLKIDRSFVKDVANQSNDREIVSAVVAMAKKLNLKVVAEGVEKGDQEAFLKQIDCEYGQGYLYSQPKPLEELLTYLKSNTRN